eukprot:Blabericola_migrator_1__5253@NODE_26_length_20894_cov_127_933788_g23_i0_p1_GENE_NODE_26_length_20894_cov_127_933788_g23_i0NODE_26_length_20894_cov_127_933788_g23_i0_p1_ORF_typecomplete_len1638_score310_90Glyco_transf_24/PF18404_1/1_1e125Glyco_transf_8/PF01501_20/3_8e18UDPg_GGTase/PF06427_11/0_052_NODE_26_length_20894_cov_127_933788_g23_i0879413707
MVTRLLVVLGCSWGAWAGSLSYRLSANPAWGCPTLIGQATLALSGVARHFDQNLDFLSRWIHGFDKSSNADMEIDLYCKAFYVDEVSLRVPSRCQQVDVESLLKSPLLKRIEDTLITNNFYAAELAANLRLSREELNITGATFDGPWISEIDLLSETVCAYQASGKCSQRLQLTPRLKEITLDADPNSILPVAGPEDAQHMFIFHSSLDTVADIEALESFLTASGSNRYLRIIATEKDCPGAYIGSWVASMTLKDSEYRTVNEAQSAGEEDAGGGAMKAESSKTLEGDFEGPDVDDILPPSRSEAVLALSEIVKDKRLIRNMAFKTLNLLVTAFQSMKNEDNSSRICEALTNEVGMDKLACLSKIVSNIPSLVELMYQLPPATPTLPKSLRKSLAALHSEIHSRWNALFLNSQSIGASPSSSSMSTSMNLGYVFEMIERELKPVALEHETLLRAGASLKYAKDLIEGKRQSLNADGLLDVARDLFNRSVQGDAATGVPPFQFTRRRWDYRPFKGAVLVRTYLEAEESDKSVITPNNFVSLSRKVVMTRASPSEWHIKMHLHDLHIVIDPGVMEDVRFLNELMADPALAEGSHIYLVPVSKSKRGASQAITNFLLDWGAGEVTCDMIGQEILRMFRLIEEKRGFMEALNTVNNCALKADPPVSYADDYGLEAPAVYVNGKGILFTPGNIPLGYRGVDGTALHVIVDHMQLSDFRLLSFAVFAMSSSIMVMEMPGGSQVFRNVKTASDLVKILSGRTSCTRVLPVVATTMEKVGEKPDVPLPCLRDFFLISSSPLVVAEDPLTHLKILRDGSRRGLSKRFQSLLRETETNLSLPPKALQLDNPFQKRVTVGRHNYTAPLALLVKANSTEEVKAAWASLPRLMTQIEAHLLKLKSYLSFDVDLKAGVVSDQVYWTNKGELRPLPSEWKDILKETPGTHYVHSPLMLTAVSNVTRVALLAANAALTLESAFNAVVFDCLGQSARFQYTLPWCPQLLRSDVESRDKLMPIWWERIMKKFLTNARGLDTPEWSAYSLFDKSSFKGVRLSAAPEEAILPLTLKAIVDPLSKWGQYMLPMLAFCHQFFGATVQLLLNPSISYTDLPVNRWSRSVMMEPLTVGENLLKRTERIPQASFGNLLRINETLTGAMESPGSWAVVTKEAELDLDNIQMHRVTSDKAVLYNIEGLYVEGPIHAVNEDTDADFAGGNTLVLNEVIDGDAEVTISDTISLRQPHYYQLRVKAPGSYRIRMLNTLNKVTEWVMDSHTSEEKQKAESWAVQLVQSTDDSTPVEYVRANVRSFRPGLLPISVRGTKKDDSETGLPGAIKSLMSWFPGGSKSSQITEVQELESKEWDADTVHIFSLASGHLYERLLRIMALSVRKNTDAKLVFWILDNFLSAKFKDRMNKMTSVYKNMEVRYVTYKWPAFLRAQVEKQRQIWAYKILFLDVLFPVTVPRIIYIDADQVVRADVKELWSVDLEGAPYAFTPFCNDRKETAQFRFWESGYWKQHLDGKPYHISALFVVDLKRYREQQVGSDLRQIYNKLSADPNSLANLDQDLPNFAQVKIPIYSLPQEWLWCETWCSDTRKPLAKTIDLCNNPLTHETKLNQAQRIVKEWIDYDKELQETLDDEALVKQPRIIRNDEL